MSKKDDKKEEKNETKKQGEELKITKTTDDDKEKDFKGSGIEGEKGTNSADANNSALIEENDRLKADNSALIEENARRKAENDELKNPKPDKEKEHVTIDDVLPTLRDKGYKI